MPETIIAKRSEAPPAVGRKLDLTDAITEVFDRARQGNTSYLTRFGFKNALVVLNQNGTETSWQVPDFAIDLEHRDKRSIIVGQANVASTKGDWQLEVRTEQRTKRQSFAITALIQNLVPSGLAGNFPSLKALKALDMVVNGESTVELSNSGQFLAGEAKLELGERSDHSRMGPRQRHAHRPRQSAGALSEGEGRRRDRPLDAHLGREQGDDQRRGHACARCERRADGLEFLLEGRRGGARGRGVRSCSHAHRRMEGGWDRLRRKTGA